MEQPLTFQIISYCILDLYYIVGNSWTRWVIDNKSHICINMIKMLGHGSCSHILKQKGGDGAFLAAVVSQLDGSCPSGSLTSFTVPKRTRRSPSTHVKFQTDDPHELAWTWHSENWTRPGCQSSSAVESREGSNYSLEKEAATAFWLCRAEL